ncbi:MAG: acetyl-CoA carboxylase biotin carboxyl carrier protein subunit [Chlorobi bacterium]|nr:acetyl-CoA carboxylase biotin carboxyl carrier protein subunit [Chlorobiota bacterium]
MNTTDKNEKPSGKGNGHRLNIDDTLYKTTLTEKFLKRKSWEKPDENKIAAFIPGTVLKIYVKKGQTVKKGDKLMILEAMKMKNKILAQKAGTLTRVHISEGDKVIKGQLLFEYA